MTVRHLKKINNIINASAIPAIPSVARPFSIEVGGRVLLGSP